MRVRSVVAIGVVLAGSAAGTAIALATGPSIVATPDDRLLDGQTVRVTGSGFAPSSHYEIFECAAGARDESRCDPRNAFEIDSDPAGRVTFPFMVDARIHLGPSGATAYDCRTEPNGCEIGVGILVDVKQSAVTPITFAAGTLPRAPVTATVSPSSGLTDGQVVQVHGAGLTPRENGWVLECRTGGAPRLCDHDRSVRLRPTDAGTLDTSYTVHAKFRTPLGDNIDCTRAPRTCSIEVSWGFAFVADRHAAVGLTFTSGSVTSVPTTAPSATRPATSAPPTSTSPAARPHNGSSDRPATLVAVAVVLAAATGALLVLLRRRFRHGP